MLAYVNLVGGQDELVFDGDSIVVDAAGTVLGRSGQFEPELLVVDLDLPAATPAMPDADERFGGLAIKRTIISSEPFAAYEPRPDGPTERMPRHEEIWTALVVGLRDYVHKNGFQSVLFGMSGGIDSTLVAAIAVDALGAGERLRRLQPQRLVERALQVRRRRAGAAHGAVARHGPDRADLRRVPGGPAPRRSRRGEPAGPHPRRHLDGTVQPARPPRAGVRQQVRARDRLLDDLRRRGRRVRPDQGRAQDARVGAREVAQPGRRRARRDAADPRGHDHQAAVGGAAARPARLATPCRRTTCSTPCSTRTSSATSARPTSSPRASTRRWSSGSSRWSTAPSTSVASTRRDPRCRAATSAATAACRSRTGGARS